MAEETYQVVNIPNVGKVRFPTSMSDDAVRAAVKKISDEAPLSAQQRAEMAAHPEGSPPGPGLTEPISKKGGFPDRPFWNGFLQSLKDQIAPAFSEQNPLLRSAAHPESLGDFLNLIIPAEIGEAAVPTMKLIRAGAMEARRGGPGLVTTARNFMKGAHEYAFSTDPHLTMTGPGGFSRYTTAPKPKAGYFGPQAPEGVDTIGQAGVNELPTYLQQQLMEEGGSQASAASGSSRVGMPPAREPVPSPDVPRQMPPLSTSGQGGSMPPLVPTAAQAGRLTGKAPTLEEELLKAVEEAGAADKPIMSTGAPDLTTAGEGPLRQSGKFGKSGSLGQPGGYTIGNPATGAPETGQTIEELLAPDTELESITRSMHETPPTSSDISRPGGVESVSGGVDPTSGTLDTRNWTQRDWADLRRAKGARDAGKLTGKTADEVRELSGGGPSQTPLEAEERIRNAANRARGEE